MAPIIPRHLGGLGAREGARCIGEQVSVLKGGHRHRVQTWVPSSGRKDEQAYLSQRDALCRNIAFRQEIQTFRELHLEKMSQYDQVQSNKLTLDAERLCERWGFEGTEWVLWLLENWDPAQTELPPREPVEFMPTLGSWVLKVEYRTQPGIEERPYRAILNLKAGISVREAQRAATVAVKAMRSAAKAKGTRPGLTELDRELLREIFNELGLPQPRGREKAIEKAVTVMKERLRPLSRSKVAAEYRRWLKDQSQPVKHYDRG